MKYNKLGIVSLVLIGVLAQGTCTYAASSSDDSYTEDELNTMTPGFKDDDIKKSNYKVNSYKNTFSSTQTEDEDTEDDTDSEDTSTTTTTSIGSDVGNIIVSTAPSTGVQGDFWGKTEDGKWILIDQGVPANGWRMVRGNWYYMDADGVMQTGWITNNSTWYYLNSDGTMAYNTYIGGYYLDWTGAMQ